MKINFENIIKKTLLKEEITAGSATVYHRDVTPPETLIDSGGFLRHYANTNGGNMYGKGVYCVYDIKSNKADYGEYLYQCHVKTINGFLIFVPEIAERVYGEWNPWKQIVRFVPKRYWRKGSSFYDKVVSRHLLNEKGKISKRKSCEYFNSLTKQNSGHVFEAVEGMSLDKNVLGIVFYGANDGYSLTCYDFTNIQIERVSTDNGGTWRDLKLTKRAYKSNGDIAFKLKDGKLYKSYGDGSEEVCSVNDFAPIAKNLYVLRLGHGYINYLYSSVKKGLVPPSELSSVEAVDDNSVIVGITDDDFHEERYIIDSNGDVTDKT